METTTIKNLINSSIEGANFKVIKGELITDYKAMHESKIYNDIFTGFVNRDREVREDALATERNTEWSAYIVGEDIYEVYKINEGFSILKKITLGCCISNSSFDEVFCCEDGFVVLERNFANCKKNRTIFGKMNKTVTTEVF